MRILVSNDDGIYSPGIAALARAATTFGDVRVVAPDVEQSSAGHAITASKPLTLRETPVIEGIEAYRADGTPADCVALGSFEWGKVDVVLSGINIGVNLGNSTWHSGTLAAAKQAQLLGIPGIAFSTPSEPEEPDYEALIPHVRSVLDLLLSQHRLPLVNVNLPHAPRGMRWTRQAVERYDGDVVPDTDPRGRPIYWFVVKRMERSAEGTDRWAMDESFISLTPLRLDLTDHAELERLRHVRADVPLGGERGQPEEMPAVETAPRAGPT